MSAGPSPDKPSKVTANRQLIAHPKSRVSRRPIDYLNDRENRHFRRAICRFCTPLWACAGHSRSAPLTGGLIASARNVQENQAIVGVAIAGSAGRAIGDQLNER
jgi:hypothetical protein